MTFPIAKPVIVLGAGGHAKVLISALRRLEADILGATDADLSRAAVLDAPVLGDDSVVQAHAPDKVLLVNGLGSTASSLARRVLFEKFAALGYGFATVVDPLALIAGPVDIAEGAQILTGATIQPDVRVGVNAIINTRASIDHDCVIGAHEHIAPGAVLSGNVRVGDSAHVGTGATVIQGIQIGANCVVGAGAVIIQDVPQNSTVGGVPARSLRGEG